MNNIFDAYADSFFENAPDTPVTHSRKMRMRRKLNENYHAFIEGGLNRQDAVAASIGMIDLVPAAAAVDDETQVILRKESRPDNINNCKEREDSAMKHTLRVYVDSLFEGAPDIPAVEELREEILSNLEERYDDCIAGGMTPQRAYTAVIGSMGDISKLIRQVSDEGHHTRGLFEKTSHARRGFFKKYSYIFSDENLKVIRRSAIAVMWLIIVWLYFLVSSFTGDWEYTWIIFLWGATLNVGIHLVGNIARFSKQGDIPESRIKILKAIHSGVSAIMWLMLTILYFVISFLTDWSQDTWMIFILAAAIQIVVNAVMKIQINRYKQ